MESAPTDLMVVLKFVCMGGYYPPAIYKNIIAFCTGSRGRLPLPVCLIFVILIVGRWLAAAVYKGFIAFYAGDHLASRKFSSKTLWSPLQV